MQYPCIVDISRVALMRAIRIQGGSVGPAMGMARWTHKPSRLGPKHGASSAALHQHVLCPLGLDFFQADLYSVTSRVLTTLILSIL